MGGTPLSVVASWTYLGAIIDNKLNFNEHCDKTLKKARSSLAIIQRTLYAAPRECKKVAYQSLVRPKLEYASTAWCPYTKTNIEKIEKVQNKAARFVTKSYDYNTSVTGLKHELGWPSLAARRKVRDCVMWYKIHYAIVFVPFPSQLMSKPRPARFDHNMAYLEVIPRVDCYKYSYFLRTAIHWNSLSADLVAAPSVDAFQRLVSAQFLGCGQP